MKPVKERLYRLHFPNGMRQCLAEESIERIPKTKKFRYIYNEHPNSELLINAGHAVQYSSSLVAVSVYDLE